MPKPQVFTVDDKTAPLPVLCKLFRIGENVVRRRLALGWSVEDAVRTPIRVFRTKDKDPTQSKAKKAPTTSQKRDVVWVRTGSVSGYYDWK